MQQVLPSFFKKKQEIIRKKFFLVSLVMYRQQTISDCITFTIIHLRFTGISKKKKRWSFPFVTCAHAKKISIISYLWSPWASAVGARNSWRAAAPGMPM